VSRLGLEDVRRIGDAIGDPRRVAATVASGEIARVGTHRATVNVQGTTDTIPLVFDRTVARGAFFTAADVETRRGWPCSAPTRPTACSPAATRSASRSPSAGSASGWSG
jgi:hypothetical protein